ncbi:hypothetical protein [uncultured Ilyobacter sp.]|uniref:hypothetical protein n=1 Tax=uncultured Ilyobacter sp. TaxID=544433 RepID=UPI0029C7A109|nr:hypothetical protein [uncultured Ilyobacter sp.]
MKRSIAIFLIIISVSACKNDSNLNPDIKEPNIIQNNSVEAEEIQEDSTEIVDDAEHEFPHEFCYIEKARLEKDQYLEELYKKLSKLQTNADEMSKYPKSPEVLKNITKEIGYIKGLIDYRSLEINAKVK